MKNLALFLSTILVLFGTVDAKPKKKHKSPTAKQKNLLLPNQLPEISPQAEPTASKRNIALISPEPEAVLAYIQNYIPTNPIIVETEARDGYATQKMAQLWPYGSIYALESIPENFTQLENKSASFLNVRRFQIMPSDKNGTNEFFNYSCMYAPNLSSQTDLPGGHSDIPNKIISVSTATLDHWAHQNNIDHIDLLLLNTQGRELKILEASPTILKTIKIIYTEVEFAETYAGQSLFQDVKKFLESEGFELVARSLHKSSETWFGNGIFLRT